MNIPELELEPALDAPPELIETQAALEQWALRLAGVEEIALDTEANSMHAYQEQMCVMQITVGHDTAIVDPLAVEDMSPLLAALGQPGLRVLMHGGDYDAILLSREFGLRFERIFDTMIAASLLGVERVGLGNLVEEAYGVKLSKKYQRVDWAVRPLTPDQIDYLRRDTIYLPGLVAWLSEALEAADFVEEAEIEFARVASREGRPPVFDPDGWRRMKGTSRLSDIGRCVMARLWAWRDSEAERRNRPPFKILGNRSMLALAENPPREGTPPHQLQALHPGERRRYGKQVARALDKAHHDREAGKTPPRDIRPKRSAEEVAAAKAERSREDKLRDWRREVAKKRKVVPTIVLPTPAMKWCATEHPKHVNDLAACPDIGPKRIARYGEEIIDALN